jgi:hypothetical protein
LCFMSRISTPMKYTKYIWYYPLVAMSDFILSFTNFKPR